MGYYGAVPAAPPVKTGGQLDVYVAGDAVSASDSNPGTIALPLKTINEAIRRCNNYDEISTPGDFVIHIAPAPVAGYTLTELLTAHLLRGSIILIGDGAGQGGDGFTVLKATTSAQAGSSNVQVVAPAGLGINTFRGKTIEMLTGAAAGDRRTIQEHTDTVIIPVRNFTAAVVANDTFRIVEPGGIAVFGTVAAAPYPLVQLAGGGSTSPLAATSGAANTIVGPPSVYFINLRLSPNTTNSPLRMSGSRVCFIGCELGPNALIVGSDSATYFGCDIGDGLAPTTIGPHSFPATAPSQISWSGWGVFTAGGCTQGNTGTVVGFLVSVVTSGSALTQLGGTFILLGGEIETSTTSGAWAKSIGAAGYGMGTFICAQELNIAPVVQIRNTNGGTGFAIDASGSTAGEGSFEIKLHRCVLTAQGTGTALLVKGNVRCTIGSGVSGTGGAVGINSSLGGATYINGAPAITGAGGNDLTVDNGASFNAVAFLAAAGDGISNAVNQALITRTS